jgi:S1-C subfamily serine protease
VRRALAAAATAAALGAAGCGGGASRGEHTTTSTVEKTRVEVVADQPSARGEPFDAHTIYQRDAPGVVTVLSITGGGGGGPLGGGQQGAEGSGFVLDGKGEVVTNAHVVTEGTGEAIRKAEQVYVRFQDGNQVSADIVGFDPNADVALLRIDPNGLTLRPLALATDKDAVVGAPVAAIGSPFGEEQSLSVGVISATDRTIDSLTDFSISGAIQTDAAINHGNSGGPLVDAGGRVLGINSQIRSQSGDGSGVGFAVPVDLVKRSVDELRASGKVEYAYLGVSTTPLYPQLAERLKLPVHRGVLVADAIKDGPAAKAGIKAGTDQFRFQSQLVPRDADVITALGGHAVRSSEDLSIILNRYKPGQSVPVQIIRDGKRKAISVALGTRPAKAGP